MRYFRRVRNPQKKYTLKPLPKKFDCPLCEEKRTCKAKIDYEYRIAVMVCAECHARYPTVAHNLTEPIDVYNEWKDSLNNDLED